MSKQHTEHVFEDAIEYDLTHGGGFTVVDKGTFDVKRVLFSAEEVV